MTFFISGTKYFLLLSLLGDHNENKAFLSVLCYPCHFCFFPLHQENGAIHFAAFTIYSLIYLSACFQIVFLTKNNNSVTFSFV